MPIYQNIKEDILNKIQIGHFKIGERIPSERELALQYHVSRMTIRQAIFNLEQEGILSKKRGSGTFVSSPDLYQDNLRSFTETLIEQNMIPSTQLIEASSVSRLDKISRSLGINVGTSYYKVKRLRLGDDIPIALETIYIPIMYAEHLLTYDLTGSLYHVLEEAYGYELSHIACEIEACISARSMMDILKLKKQKALLKLTGITYDQNDRKLFYEESYYVSEHYKYRVDIFGRP